MFNPYFVFIISFIKLQLEGYPAMITLGNSFLLFNLLRIYYLLFLIYLAIYNAY